ncbi:single-stranded DNA-binding protein [Tundrisphaera lichenicola]|uniref:single-stranded DNA-binding protein n=1 Tax=Tundrisphaera lichenicola TaxID=2029860 RepID=UPI003EBE7196
MGNLTRDPELRRLANGTAVTDLGLALNRSFMGKDGEKREEVVFIDVTVWDRQAETCCQYLKKGRAVHVEGFLKMDTWEDKNSGEKRSKVKVQADRVQFLDRREDSGGVPGGEDDYSAPAPRDSAPRRSSPDPRSMGNGPSRAGFNNSTAPSTSPRRPPSPPVDADDDDIPF